MELKEKKRLARRRNDADYCRFKGWVPGTSLTVQIGRDDYAGRFYTSSLTITAIGERAILVKRGRGRRTSEERWVSRLINALVVEVNGVKQHE